MSDIAIRVENISKLYRIGGRNERYKTLRDTVVSPFRGLATVTSRFHSPQSEIRNGHDTIWALKDISFEVKRGEVVGIIGRNGAGKSTLLKILSRTTEPTEGEADIRGRVGSLLEVGTGFHPELTGRENIYLNGAILGMKKADIERKFSEIVSFAEIEGFTETPVKHYSSGMYLRLAFAVAAHLDPDILIVDEVLAVGDAAFQKKCLATMSDAAKTGQTVILVSHNMPIVQNLCQRTLVLENGYLALEGRPVDCISYYLAGTAASSADVELTRLARCRPDLMPILTRLRILDPRGNPVSSVGCGEGLQFQIAYDAPVPLMNSTFGITVSTQVGIPVFFLQTRVQMGLIERMPSRGMVLCRLREIPLVPGDYFLTIGCSSNGKQVDLLEQAARITVEPRDYFRTGYLPHHTNGVVLVNACWQVVDGERPQL